VKRLAILLLLMTLVPLPLLAQEQETMDDQGTMQSTESPYADADAGWKEHRFHVAGTWGGLAGGTAVGLTENLAIRTQFEVDSGSLYTLRAGWVFAPRFDLEIEYGHSSPGLNAVITDLGGQGKTVVPFADLGIEYLMAAVNYSVIERTHRIVPYLTLGIGTVKSDSSDESRIGNREPGIVYGAGLRVRVIDMIAVRGDVRGMRSGLGTNQQKEGDLPGVFVNDFNASFLIWSVGVEIRF